MLVMVDIDEKWPIYSLRVGDGNGSIYIPEELFEEYTRIQLEYYNMQKILGESYDEQSSRSNTCGRRFPKGTKCCEQYKFNTIGDDGVA